MLKHYIVMNIVLILILEKMFYIRKRSFICIWFFTLPGMCLQIKITSVQNNSEVFWLLRRIQTYTGKPVLARHLPKRATFENPQNKFLYNCLLKDDHLLDAPTAATPILSSCNQNYRRRRTVRVMTADISYPVLFFRIVILLL